jgi:hypothetical protein
MFKAEHNIKSKESIAMMLKCLLSKNERSYNKCKNCEKVDACCFLIKAVSVCQYNNMGSTGADIKGVCNRHPG